MARLTASRSCGHEPTKVRTHLSSMICLHRCYCFILVFVVFCFSTILRYPTLILTFPRTFIERARKRNCGFVSLSNLPPPPLPCPSRIVPFFLLSSQNEPGSVTVILCTLSYPTLPYLRADIPSCLSYPHTLLPSQNERGSVTVAL